MSLQKFYFESMTDSGKQVSGYLFAEDQIQAREKLKRNKMIVMSLKQYTEETQTEGMQKYEFEASDREGKIFHGEIEDINEYEVYKKLISDYEFTVNYLIDVRLEPSEKEEKKKQGIDPNWAIKMKEDVKDTKEINKKVDVPVNQSEKLDTILQEKQEKMEFLQKQIDEIIEKVQTLVNKHDQIIQPDKRRSIQGTLDRMSRLRRSNSVEHLKGIMLELFEMMSGDDMFVNLQGEMLQDMESVKGEFKTFSLGFTNKINKGLSSVTIDTKGLKKGFEKILKARFLLKEVFEIINFFFIGMLVSGTLFLILSTIKSIIQNDFEIVGFYLQSVVFWFLFVFAGLLSGFLFWQNQKGLDKTWKQNLSLSALFFAGLSFLFLEFPVLFFWTQF